MFWAGSRCRTTATEIPESWIYHFWNGLNRSRYVHDVVGKSPLESNAKNFNYYLGAVDGRSNYPQRHGNTRWDNIWEMVQGLLPAMQWFGGCPFVRGLRWLMSGVIQWPLAEKNMAEEAAFPHNWSCALQLFSCTNFELASHSLVLHRRWQVGDLRFRISQLATSVINAGLHEHITVFTALQAIITATITAHSI